MNRLTEALSEWTLSMFEERVLETLQKKEDGDGYIKKRNKIVKAKQHSKT